MQLRFISRNDHKIREATAILKPYGVEVVAVSRKIDEIQSEDVRHLVRDKVLRAFQLVGKPLFVEHTGLEVAALNGLPAGLTQIFWDRLQADAFATLISGLPNSDVVAKTVIGYCDGQKLHYFEGKINGRIADTPKGSRDFQWDCVFIPDGETRTFAELGEKKKNEISMRRLALDELGSHLEKAK